MLGIIPAEYRKCNRPFPQAACSERVAAHRTLVRNCRSRLAWPGQLRKVALSGTKELDSSTGYPHRVRVPSFLFLYSRLPHASSARWQVRVQSFCLFSRATFCTTSEVTFLLTSQRVWCGVSQEACIHHHASRKCYDMSALPSREPCRCPVLHWMWPSPGTALPSMPDAQYA